METVTVIACGQAFVLPRKLVSKSEVLAESQSPVTIFTDPAVFIRILEFFRHGDDWVPPRELEMMERILAEAKSLEIPRLVEMCTTSMKLGKPSRVIITIKGNKVSVGPTISREALAKVGESIINFNCGCTSIGDLIDSMIVVLERERFKLTSVTTSDNGTLLIFERNLATFLDIRAIRKYYNEL